MEGERQNLQKIAEILANTCNTSAVNTESKRPTARSTTEQRHIPTIPTENRFDVLADQIDATGSSSPSYEDQILNYRQSHRSREDKLYDVVVVGDSMLKHIDGQRLSRRKKVACKSQPGAKVEHLSPQDICASLKEEGEATIHAGTNNGMEGPGSVHSKIVTLSDTIVASGRRVCISGIIHRRWESAYDRRRVDTLNNHIHETAAKRGWGFIDNTNVGERFLSGDGVHVNKSGEKVLAGNLSRYINRRLHQLSDTRRKDHPVQHRQDIRNGSSRSMDQPTQPTAEAGLQPNSTGETKQRNCNQEFRSTPKSRRVGYSPTPMHQPSQPRSYAETAAAAAEGGTTTSSSARGVQQDFNMEFRRSRIKPSSHSAARGQNPSQWQDYLQYVRKVMNAGSH